MKLKQCACEALERLDKLKAHYAHQHELNKPFAELMRQWRIRLWKTPLDERPSKLYMADADLDIVAEYHERFMGGGCDNVYASYFDMRGSEPYDCVLFYIDRIPVYRRRE